MAGNMRYKNSVKTRLGTWNIGKFNIDLCSLLEVRWRVCWARLVGLHGMKDKLRWSGNREWYGGVGVLVIEELYDKVVVLRRVNDRVRPLAIVLEEEVVRVVWAYAPQGGKSMEEK